MEKISKRPYKFITGLNKFIELSRSKTASMNNYDMKEIALQNQKTGKAYYSHLANIIKHEINYRLCC